MLGETRTLVIIFVILLAAGLGACVASQNETTGAQIAPPPTTTPTPAMDLAPSPTPVTEGGDSIPGLTPVVTTASNAALPNAVPDDTRIIINAPAHRMDVFESGKLVKSYRIGIGYPKYPLPEGMREVNEIIFNPTWTPPDEPWVESKKSKVKVGQKVAAGSKLNPLGLVKIPIGLPSLIHGGKSPAQLGGFASHGCVGLTNAQVVDLSKRLAQLRGIEITDEQITEYRRKRTKTKYITLEWPIPVELRYETIVVEDGKLYFYPDVYNRGTNTEENLRNVLGAYGMTLEALSESERLQVMAALNQKGNSAGKKLTTRGKTEKETVVEIAALAGKGYSAPVDLDAGKNASNVTANN